MKILVTEMPLYPSDCVFADNDYYYNTVECRLSDHGCYECSDVNKCPYLKVLEVK